MRIVLLGVTRVALESFRCLRELGMDVVGILTTPREFKISYAQSTVVAVQYVDLAEAAEAAGIPVITVNDRMREYAATIRDLAPELLLVGGWYHLIPPALLAIPPFGCVGVHASLLPKYRGGAPVNWAIINGEQTTGVTLFYLDDGIDTGDIIGQVEVPIASEDTCGTVYEKVIAGTRVLIRRYVPLIAQGSAPRIQQDHAAATRFPQRRPEDGAISWSCTTRQVYDWVRALTRPYPGAFTVLAGRRVRVWRSSILERGTPAAPGTILGVDPYRSIDVATLDGSLRLSDLEGCPWELVGPGTRCTEAA